MPLIVTRSPRTRQPIGHAARVAALPGLRNLWNFGDRTGKCLVTGTQFTLNSDPVVASFSQAGTLVANSSTHGAFGAYASLDWKPQACTIIIGYKQTSGVVAWSLMDSSWNGWYATSGEISQTAAVDFSGTVTPTPGPSVAHARVRVAAISGAANDLRVSIDGGDIAADTACNLPSISSTAMLRIGSDYSNGNYADMEAAFIALLDRASPNAALLAYSTNPWGYLFAPTERRIWVPSASVVPSITAVYADSVTASSVVPRVTLDFA